MLKFNVMKQQTNLFGHIVPKGAIYGKVAFTYDRYIKTSEYIVKDKKGNIVIKDGKPKTRNTYKTVPTKTGCVYSCEWYGTYSHKGQISLEVYILYDNAQKWQLVHLGDTQFTRMLQEFIFAKMQEWEKNGYKFELPEHVKQGIQGKPLRKEVQKEFNYRGNPKSWALNPNYITDNIIIDMPRQKTNMDKLHPHDDKPIYCPMAKSPKKRKTEDQPSKVLSCRIYHKDGVTVTTIK